MGKHWSVLMNANVHNEFAIKSGNNCRGDVLLKRAMPQKFLKICYSQLALRECLQIPNTLRTNKVTQDSNWALVIVELEVKHIHVYVPRQCKINEYKVIYCTLQSIEQEMN